LAAAQDDGVFFDPGGPSDKEYAMPHVQARGGGGETPPSGSSDGTPSSGESGGSGGASTGGNASGGGDASDEQLFGEGVTRAQRNADALSGRGAAQAAAISPASADTDGMIGLGWFAAIAALVALMGGGIAYVTRTRGRGPPS
jgi:hypothetical protein